MNTRHTVIESPLGELTVVADGDALIGLYFRHHWYRPSAETFGPRVNVRSDDVLAETQSQLGDYLAGDRPHFDLPTALRGDDLQRRIWKRLTNIPYGETMTYGELADGVGGRHNGAGSRSSRRPQPDLDHRSVPPSGRQERQADRLCRRVGTKAVPARSRGACRAKRGSVVLMAATKWQKRVDSADWDAVTAEINDVGGALLPQLITKAEAAKLRGLYTEDGLFRATIDMSQYRFGEGEYRYFDRPYPQPIDELKRALYPRLLPIARDWWSKLSRQTPWPDDLDDWLEMCHAAGQTRSTAILLKYGSGDWNALHRDLYGDLVFPLQVVINLSEPGVDHTGGEFLLLEQRPRAQSRGTATLLPHGHGFVFTTRERPVQSARGWSAAPVRHGVSAVRSGERFTLGLVFHDAA